MLETIATINSAINNFIWGVPAMICIIGVGLILSFRTGFIRIRKFGHALKMTIGRIFEKKEASDGATADLGLIWNIADTCNGLMAIPNLIALFLLSGTVVKLVKEPFK